MMSLLRESSKNGDGKRANVFIKQERTRVDIEVVASQFVFF